MKLAHSFPELLVMHSEGEVTLVTFLSTLTSQQENIGIINISQTNSKRDFFWKITFFHPAFLA